MNTLVQQSFARVLHCNNKRRSKIHPPASRGRNPDSPCATLRQKRGEPGAQACCMWGMNRSGKHATAAQGWRSWKSWLALRPKSTLSREAMASWVLRPGREAHAGLKGCTKGYRKQQEARCAAIMRKQEEAGRNPPWREERGQRQKRGQLLAHLAPAQRQRIARELWPLLRGFTGAQRRPWTWDTGSWGTGRECAEQPW